MANNRLAIFLFVLPLGFLGSPVSAQGSFCGASASFSGHYTEISLHLDRTGSPATGSEVLYEPAGEHDDLHVMVLYPLNVDQPPQVTTPSSLQVSARVAPNQAQGQFVLTVGDQEVTSHPIIVTTGKPEWHGKVEVHQNFETSRPLLNAIAAGGTGHLSYLDGKGGTLAQTDLDFAAHDRIQNALDKSYPAALANAKQCKRGR